MKNKTLHAVLVLQAIAIIALLFTLLSLKYRGPSSVEAGPEALSGVSAPAEVDGAGFALRRLDRGTLAQIYIEGTGLEIGALHLPTDLPPTANVKYVDILTNEELTKHYPEIPPEQMVPVDIVDDGQYLRTIEAGTQDFVIANHFLEHCENPIVAVENMLRVLKPGGILFMAVPDKRYTFDKNRPVTSFEHLLRDYREGPGWSRRQHFEEWAAEVHKAQTPEDIAAEADRLMEMGYSIHFHVWRQVDISELLVRLQKELQFPFDVEVVCRSAARGREVIFVLEKTS